MEIRSMMKVTILSLLVLCTITHHCNCLPRKAVNEKIEAKVASLLRRLTKTNDDEQPVRKGKETYEHIPNPADKRTAIVRQGFDACWGIPVDYTANSGIIQSPGYAWSSYPDNFRCQWRITAPTGNVISVTFWELSLQAHSSCAYDRVTLYDGSSVSSSQLGKYCTGAPARITSSGSSLFIVFTSDSSIHNGRFSLSWSFVGQESRGCGNPAVEPDVSSRIVGGVEARPHSWPWQCSVVSPGVCGGSVIDEYHILTAAHCVYSGGSQIPDNTITVTCGRHNWQDSSESATEQRFTGVTATVHERFDYHAILNDIAILRLPTALTFNDYVQPVCLPSSPVPVGTNCIATGWGDTKGTGDDNVLRQIVLPIVDSSSWSACMRDGSLCAGPLTGNKSTCQGDSGGPLVCKQGDKWFQYGVSSFVYSCTDPGYPAGFADVVFFKQWIEQQIPNGKSGRSPLDEDPAPEPVGKDESKPPLAVSGVKKKRVGSKPPADQYKVEKELLDLLQRKFADD